MRTLRLGVVLVLMLVAAVAANLALLTVATGPHDPVGRLSPRAGVVQIPDTTPVHIPATASSPTTTTTTRPPPVTTTTRPGNETQDD
jgi:hypothetical protein